jgi:hypothetical protein
VNEYREIDVVLFDGETVEDAMTDMIETADAKVTWLLVNEVGPSGHPNVLIVGTPGEIKQFCGWMDLLVKL